MVQRLLIAAGLVAAVVVALVLLLGGDTTERRDGIVAHPVPVTDAPPSNSGTEAASDPEDIEAQVAEALAEGLADEGSEMAARSAMRGDGGSMGAMSASAMDDLADPFLYQTPRERERRAEAARNRNWRSLDLVNGLIIGISEGIEKARDEGNTERMETLEATKARLEARRDALRRAVGDSPRPEPAE